MQILLATDGSPSSAYAGDLLKRLPLPPDSALTILTVIDKLEILPAPEEMVNDERGAHQQWQQALYYDAEQLLAQEYTRFTNTGWTLRTAMREGPAAHQIVQTANEMAADLIVIGSRGLGSIRRFLLGSVSHQVMTYAPCSVLIAREPHDDDSNTTATTTTQHGSGDLPWRLLVAYDGSPMAQAAVETVASLPLHTSTEIRVTSVLTLITSYRMDVLQTLSASWQEKKQATQASLERTAELLRRATPQVTTELREGENPSQEILQAAEAFGAQLIVMGHRGRSGIERFLLGSVANHVVHHAPCSVWVARR
jgi:nucleotide-binding universal stress UspA family protein